jgi:hypothetical protein
LPKISLTDGVFSGPQKEVFRIGQTYLRLIFVRSDIFAAFCPSPPPGKWPRNREKWPKSAQFFENFPPGGGQEKKKKGKPGLPGWNFSKIPSKKKGHN